jgi:hypothetical protein
VRVPDPKELPQGRFREGRDLIGETIKDLIDTF